MATPSGNGSGGTRQEQPTGATSDQTGHLFQKVGRANDKMGGSLSKPAKQNQAEFPQSERSKTPQTRVTNPMLQNLSNPSNLSHEEANTGQQMAPNLYFGRQFDDWSGQMAPMAMPHATGELPRFQPGQFGGYAAPNTYYGNEFSSWSNLSSGSITPSYLGAWSYSPW